MKKLPKINIAQMVKASLPYLIIGLLATKLGEAYRLATGADILDKVLGAFTTLGTVFQKPFPSLYPFDLLVGASAVALVRAIVYFKAKNAKKYRHGEEYGTARWGNEKDIAPFLNPDFSQNILLTDTERLTLGKIADPEKRNVNLNVLVIGGSGSGRIAVLVEADRYAGSMSAEEIWNGHRPDQSGRLPVKRRSHATHRA